MRGAGVSGMELRGDREPHGTGSQLQSWGWLEGTQLIQTERLGKALQAPTWRTDSRPCASKNKISDERKGQNVREVKTGITLFSRNLQQEGPSKRKVQAFWI